jgi:hypothetical protein
VDHASTNPNPPWKTKKRRRKTVREPLRANFSAAPLQWTREAADNLLNSYGVSTNEPFRFKINLCKDGSVVTDDGEYIGSWDMDENAHPSFTPDGATEPLIFDVFVGSLCDRIRAWHEADTRRSLSEP